MPENWGLKQDARAKGKGLRNAVIGRKKYSKGQWGVDKRIEGGSIEEDKKWKNKKSRGRG